jgi:hypothetical protein
MTDSHKPQAKLSSALHPIGTRFLAVASFGFTNTIQECVVENWAPSGQFVCLHFPMADRKDWVPVQSFDIVEVLNANKTKRTTPKAPR